MAKNILAKRVSAEKRLRLRSEEESSIRPLVKTICYHTLKIDSPLPAYNHWNFTAYIS